MTKDMPCQHVLYQSYLCYSSIIKIRLVFVSIYNSQYQQIRFFLGIIPASLLGEQCPDGRFLLVGNSQALLIIAVAMAARSSGTLF